MRSERTQIDGLEDEYSEMAAMPIDETMITRQEFKDEADLNILLGRFGVTSNQERPMQWGQEIDYNTDLQQALHAIAEARKVERTVPDELRAKYPTWRHVLTGVETGEYADDCARVRADRKKAEDDAKELADLRTSRAAAAPPPAAQPTGPSGIPVS